jgi:hypothetical protein
VVVNAMRGLIEDVGVLV